MLAKEVETRKQTVIAEATDQARLMLRKQANDYIAGSLREFAKRLAIKAVLIGCVGIVVLLAPLEPSIQAAILVSMFAAFLVWDAIATFPTVRLIWAKLRSSGFNPKDALATAVTSHVLAEAMRRIDEVKLSRTETFVLVASGSDAASVKTEVAEAVSKLTGDASWSDIQPFLLLASTKGAIMFALYGAYIWYVLTTVF